MDIVYFEGGPEGQQRLTEEWGYNYVKGSLGIFEEAHLRTSWDELLGNNGIFVGDLRTIRIEGKNGEKAFLKLIIAGYHTEKNTDRYMKGHKYVQVYCFPQNNPPTDVNNLTDEELNRMTIIWIYQGHDSDGSDYLTVISHKFYEESKC